MWQTIFNYYFNIIFEKIFTTTKSLPRPVRGRTAAHQIRVDPTPKVYSSGGGIDMSKGIPKSGSAVLSCANTHIRATGCKSIQAARHYHF